MGLVLTNLKAVFGIASLACTKKQPYCRDHLEMSAKLHKPLLARDWFNNLLHREPADPRNREYKSSVVHVRYLS